MGEMKIEPMIDKKSLSELLGVSSDWIDQARRELGLPHYKLGRHVRFKVKEVLAWIKERKING